MRAQILFFNTCIYICMLMCLICAYVCSVYTTKSMCKIHPQKHQLITVTKLRIPNLCSHITVVSICCYTYINYINHWSQVRFFSFQFDGVIVIYLYKGLMTHTHIVNMMKLIGHIGGACSGLGGCEMLKQDLGMICLPGK